MPKKHRLSRADFTALSARSRRISGGLFSLSIAPSPLGTKVACVVSKKVSPKAVVRNLVKRRARAILREALKNFDKPLLLSFHAKTAARDASYAEIDSDVRRLLSKV